MQELIAAQVTRAAGAASDSARRRACFDVRAAEARFGRRELGVGEIGEREVGKCGFGRLEVEELVWMLKCSIPAVYIRISEKAGNTVE